MRRALFIVSCALIGGLMGVARVPSETNAHLVDTYYTNHAQSEIWTIGYLQADLNNTTAINTINRAPGPWNNVSGSLHNFSYYGGRDATRVWTGSACTTGTDNVWIMSHALSGSLLGSTYACFSSQGTIIRSVILLDVRTEWDINGGTVPFNDIDLEGLVVHELGHATGFGLGQALDHFLDSDTACSADLATMCDSLVRGSGHWRSLNVHDQHTYKDEYD